MKRVIDTDFWIDDKVIEAFTPNDRLFFLYLMTNPHTTQLGVYGVSRKVMSFELGFSENQVEDLLKRFEEDHQMIFRSKKTNEIVIKNYLRHSIVKGGKPVEDLLTREIEKVRDRSLLVELHDHLKGFENLNESVKKILPLLIININANENAVSYHDSYNDSYHDSFKPITKKRPTSNIIEHDYSKIRLGDPRKEYNK